MTDPRGIVAAGAIALVATGAHAAYVAWPATHGVEVHVPATLEREPADAGFVRVRLPYERIALDVPHRSPALSEPYEPMRRSGDWWTSGGDTRANARRLRSRSLYVQLTPQRPSGAAGPMDMRAFTVGNGPVDGVVNLAGTVTFVREDGYLRLDFGIAPIAVPRDVPAGPAIALLRVLPSGRAVLAGVSVNGTRY